MTILTIRKFVVVELLVFVEFHLGEKYTPGDGCLGESHLLFSSMYVRYVLK